MSLEALLDAFTASLGQEAPDPDEAGVFRLELDGWPVRCIKDAHGFAVLEADVGQVPEDESEARLFLEKLMTEALGAIKGHKETLAFNAERGAATLSVRADPRDMDAGGFRAFLQRFVNRLRHCRPLT